MHSGAGRLTEMLYQLLAGRGRRARDSDARPARAAHAGREPADVRLDSRRADSCPRLARRLCVPGRSFGRFVKEACGGVADWAIPIRSNRMLMEEPWDLIINVGHVVPHEVLGFANHNKNYFIGLGGKDIDLRRAHGGRLLRHREQPRQPDHAGAGLLQQGGRRVSRPAARSVRASGARPQRRRTSSSTPASTSATIWRRISPRPGNRASRTSRCFDEPVKKIVCVMQGDEFFSTWVANKAVYRTRMALADGGELVIIAPGPQAVRRAAGGRRVHPQVRLLRHAAGDGPAIARTPTCRTWPTPRPT